MWVCIVSIVDLSFSTCSVQFCLDVCASAVVFIPVYFSERKEGGDLILKLFAYRIKVPVQVEFMLTLSYLDCQVNELNDQRNEIKYSN